MTDGHIEWKMQSNPHELENFEIYNYLVVDIIRV